MNLTQVATDAFGNTLGESVAAEIMAHRAVARTAAASTKTFAEDHEARTATNPLTNDGARVPGENYRVVTGGSESDFNLVKGLGNLQTAGKLSDDVDNFNALYRGPKVYVIGSYLTPAEKQASIIEERLVAEYGSRANYETVAAAKGARDSAVGSIRGIGGAILGTYRYITGDKATRSAVAEALNRLSSMPAGSILNAVGKGIVDASFVGVAGAFADRNPYAAGAGIGGAASGVLIPFAGSLAAKGLGSITEVEALAKLGLRELPPVRPNVDRMAPGDIRFTQDTISPNFSDGGTISDAVANLRSGKISVDDFPAIRVVERNNITYTLDNRRLATFSAAQIEDIPVQRLSLSDPNVMNEFLKKYRPIEDGQKIIVVPSKGRSAARGILKQFGKYE